MSKLNSSALQSIHARTEMVNGNFPLTDEHKAIMNQIREAASQFSKTLREIAFDSKVEIDAGRWINALDSIQNTKNVACDAIILPMAPKLGSPDQ